MVNCTQFYSKQILNLTSSYAIQYFHSYIIVKLKNFEQRAIAETRFNTQITKKHDSTADTQAQLVRG